MAVSRRWIRLISAATKLGDTQTLSGGQALIVDAAVPGVGNVIEQLADELSVSPEGDEEFLHVRLAYTNGG